MAEKYHIDIPRTTKIGYGFLLLHGGPVVINASAVIGDNVNFGHFSTVGSLYFHGATIDDEVYIGPSVCIVEGVHIGKGATIGAGAVVVNDVPAGATVAGVPARVLRKLDEQDRMNVWDTYMKNEVPLSQRKRER